MAHISASCHLFWSVLHPDGLQHMLYLSLEMNNGRMNLQSEKNHFCLCTKSNLTFCKSRSHVKINVTVVLSCTNFIGKNRYSQEHIFSLKYITTLTELSLDTFENITILAEICLNWKKRKSQREHTELHDAALLVFLLEMVLSNIELSTNMNMQIECTSCACKEEKCVALSLAACELHSFLKNAFHHILLKRKR